jgi:hypothetical protein
MFYYFAAKSFLLSAEPASLCSAAFCSSAAEKRDYSSRISGRQTKMTIQ